MNCEILTDKMTMVSLLSEYEGHKQYVKSPKSVSPRLITNTISKNNAKIWYNTNFLLIVVFA